jgi:YbgC/YbaW family acyl-CoA thioester hydrolase
MNRSKVILPDNFSFCTNMPIRITDINHGGHVGNDRYLTYLHEARQQFLNHFGYTELDVEGIGLVMADAVLEYKKELHYGHNLRIWVTAADFDKLGFDVFYKLEVAENDDWKIAAKAKTSMVAFDFANRKKMIVPDAAVKKLQHH